MSLETLLEATLILGTAWGLAFALARASPASRHLAWTAALSGVLVLPLLSWALPVQKVVLPSWTGASAMASAWTEWSKPGGMVGVDSMTLTWIWSAGLAVVAAWFLVGRIQLALLARAATPLAGADWYEELARARRSLGVRRQVRLLASGNVRTPMTWGLVRAVVLLPDSVESWSASRRRVVLLHEMAHLARVDYATQALAWAACATYWFHPLAWLAAGRSWTERERACDQAVLGAGTTPAEYAAHLLALGKDRVGTRAADAAAVRLARPRLEERMIAALAFEEGAVGASRATTVGVLAIVSTLVLAAATLRPVPHTAVTASPLRHHVERGDVHVVDVERPVIASTGLGDVRIMEASSDVHARSAEGDVEIRLAPTREPRRVRITALGDVRIYVPAGEGVSLTLEATRNEGQATDPDILTPWTLSVERIDDGGLVRATGVIGNGRTRIRAHATGGDIHVLVVEGDPVLLEGRVRRGQRREDDLRRSRD